MSVTPIKPDTLCRSSSLGEEPALIVEYRDPLRECTGWFVRDRLVHSLCAGGMRVQQDLSRGHLIAMARNMTMKMRIAGLRVDGAKCGIAYDPAAADLEAAIIAFLSAIKPYVETTFSMGPDLNVSTELLDRTCRQASIPSMKMAIARAQGWDLAYFFERDALLRVPLQGAWTLGKLRAGHGVAAAALAVLDYLGIPHSRARIAVQGFGALARAAMAGLAAAGASIVAVSDDEKSLFFPENGAITALDRFLDRGDNRLPADLTREVPTADRAAIFAIPCDLLLLAAVEGAVTADNADQIMARAIVPGANLAVTAAAEALLFQKGKIVLPDFLAGCGGSLSMEGLFGPDQHPTPEQVLAHVANKMAALTTKILHQCENDGRPPREAALELCGRFKDQPGTRPYGIRT